MMRNITSINIKKAGFARLISLCLVIAVMLGALLGMTGGTAAAAYNDTASHWAREAIDRWSGYGMLNGVAPNRFEPDRTITRAEFLAVINRAFGATATAGISNFRDVTAQSWYYNDIARAVKMGTTNGTSATTMSPNAAVTRQEAVVILGRALSIYADGYETLQTFKDAGLVAPYARTHVSAFVDLGYISGYDGYINPTTRLTRAEAVTILDKIFGDVISEAKTLATSYSSPKSVLVKTPGATISGSVSGDLIIGDGVGSGDVTLQNLTIAGRLVLRGGGANSVKLNNVTVRGGTVVQNPNGTTRVVLADSSIGGVTARTDVIIEGPGASSVTVPAGLSGRVAVTLSNADMDAVNLASPADVKLLSGTVDNVYFQPGARGSTFDIAAGAKVSRMSIDAQDVTVTGAGTLEDVSINASGANISMTPKTYYIGDNLSAMIGGVMRYGRQSSQTGSNVSRQNTALYVTQNAAQTGGTGISMSTVTAEDGNSVNVSQLINTKIPLTTRNNRLAYWIGFFIPNPGDGTAAVSVTYSFDGTQTTQNIAQTTKDGKRGLEIAIPVTRYEDGAAQGALDDEIFINWGGGQYETMWLRSGTLELATPTAAEEAILVGYFRDGVYRAYNGVTYNGSEAIRRLLATDNALGLTRRGFTALAESGMNNVAIKLNGERSLLTTRAAVQERLFIALAGEGAFYAINRATSAEQVKGIIELKDFGYQIGISDLEMSKYYTLSQAGRLSVARTVLLSRGTDYKTEEDLAKVLISAVDAMRTSEVTLLTSINASRTREDMQKLLENKTNSILIDIITDADPYKSMDAAQKAYVMGEIFGKKPFVSLDEIHDLFISLVGIPSVPPVATEKVLGVAVDTSSITIEVGATASIDATVTTSSGTNDDVSYTVDKSNIATVDDSGTVRGGAKGTAKVTVASATDATKKTTVTVNVVEPVPATAIVLSRETLEVGVGKEISIIAKLTPTNSTSRVEWSSDDPTIAKISGDGKSVLVVGENPGVTMINARVEREGIAASCIVTVVSQTPGVAIYPDEITVGLGTSQQVRAVVSPTSLSNRAVTWSSKDSAIAMVDPQGNVTGVSAGETTVVATSKFDNKLFAECKVIVDPNMKGITLDKNELTLYKNGAEIVVATVIPPGNNAPVSWSYNGELVTKTDVYENGQPVNGKVMLTGKKAGTFTLVAYMDAGGTTVAAECQVTVLSTEISITMPGELKVKVGDEPTLKVTFKPATITNKTIEWSSNMPDVVSIDPVSGIMKAHKAGKAQITARPQANREGPITCIVTVENIAVTSVTVPAAVEIVKNNQTEIPITIKPDNATYDKIVWKTPNEGIIQVDGAKITGVKSTFWEEEVLIVDTKGQPIPHPDTGARQYETKMVDHPITLTVEVGDKSATCKVSVTEYEYTPVTNIYINLTSWVFPVNSKQNLNPIFNKNQNASDQPSNRKVEWTSSRPGVAYVDDSDFLVCKSPGVTEITAISWDGSVTDTKTVVIANVGLDALNPLGGLSGDPTYGAWLGLDFSTNFRKNVTATPVNTDATDTGLIWKSFQPDIATVSLNETTKQGVVTSVASGWAKVTIQPAMASKYGFATRADPSEMKDGKPVDMSNVIGDTSYSYPNKLSDTANESKLYFAKDVPVPPPPPDPEDDPDNPTPPPPTTYMDGYYGPNKNMDGEISYISKENIYDIPLVVKNEIIEGAPHTNNVFYVWAGTGAPMAPDTQSLGFAGGIDEGSIDVNKTITIDAVLNWGSADKVTWEITDSDDNTVNGNKGDDVEIVSKDGKTTSNHAKLTLKGMKPGTYTITVMAETPGMISTNGVELQTERTEDNGKAFEIKYTLTVGNVPATGIEITGVPSPAVVYNNESITLEYKLTPEDATGAIIKWEIAAPATGSLLSIDGTDTAKTCVVKAAASETGTATIKVTYTNPNDPTDKKTATVDLMTTARPKVTGVTLSSTTATVGAFQSIEITAAVVPANAKIVNVEWNIKSDSETPAVPGGTTPIISLTEEIDTDTGLEKLTQKVFGFNPGTAIVEVTVTGVEGSSDTQECLVTVANVSAGMMRVTIVPIETESSVAAPPLESVKLRSTMTAIVGKPATLVPYVTPFDASKADLKWESSNKAVATVENGVVTGLKAGSAKITVSDGGKIKATCTVTVKAKDDKPVKSISLSKQTLAINAGASSTLTVKYNPSTVTAKGVTWSSSDEKVARVEPTGKVIGVSGGKATITATSDSGGFIATCEVTVKVPVKSVTMSEKTIKLKVGETFKLGVTVNPDDATDKTAKWTSSSSSVASVSEDGTVTAKKAGTTTITVTIGGKKATCKVTVVK